MAASNALLLELSPAQRSLVEAWLVKFEQFWQEGWLLALSKKLPDDPHLQLPLLIEMIKIDLELHWRQKQRLCLEDYIRDFPEIGPMDSLPADLIQAEYEVRQ